MSCKLSRRTQNRQTGRQACRIIFWIDRRKFNMPCIANGDCWLMFDVSTRWLKIRLQAGGQASPDKTMATTLKRSSIIRQWTRPKFQTIRFYLKLLLEINFHYELLEIKPLCRIKSWFPQKRFYWIKFEKFAHAVEFSHIGAKVIFVHKFWKMRFDFHVRTYSR